MSVPAPRAAPTELERRLRAEIRGEVLFDRFSRGRYSTDASIYQIEPLGVVIPRDDADVALALQVAASLAVPVLPRGAGTSQCGQTVGEALVIDTTAHLDALLEVDPVARRAWVQPGLVLDRLNAQLKRHGLFFPVDVSTAAQATLGGMTGNNSCGSRSLRYGNMVHNVRSVDAWLASGECLWFGELPTGGRPVQGPAALQAIVARLEALWEREAEEVAQRFPKVQRRVGGYNLDLLGASPRNLGRLLVGSEGTLGFFRRIELELQPLLPHRTLGVCHFPTFYQSMALTRHIVELGPTAVELVDRTMIDLALGNPEFRPVLERILRGEPDALLLVEFAGEDHATQVSSLQRLVTLMADLGLPGSVVEVLDPAQQREIWEVRKAGLNIMMSMQGDGKPVSFIEDCAVPLEHLADYTQRLTEVFERNGTRGTWYAHASVGCLHVRPVLNMKEASGSQRMRAIAEEAAALVREYKGSYSGEHGDGLVRSEWIEPMFGARLTRAFEEVKAIFDPQGLFNPGKIVRPPRMDDRSLYRYKPGYRSVPLDTALDWTNQGGFAAAVEMCNNNGACRKRDAAVMCPSFRATGEEQHLTRGRANTLRLALSGQLGEDAFTSPQMHEAMSLCVSCKGCRRECPTGVDMARMKVEFLHHYTARHGLTPRQRLFAWLPRYAAWGARFSALLALRDRLPVLARLSERWFGLAARRPLPRFRNAAGAFAGQPRRREAKQPGAPDRQVVLFVDTFSRWFEPENLSAARAVLAAAGYAVIEARPRDGTRPLCCGRTFLGAGLVAQARIEAKRTLEALSAFVAQGIPVLGLEPSCLLGFRDELPGLLPGPEADALAAGSFLLEEFLAREQAAGTLHLPLKALPGKRALLHGHCHQKAFGAMGAVEQTLRLVPSLHVETLASSCCGMAGSFGYEAEHYDVSLRMAEADLFPRVREAAPDTLIVADGTSCRQQIRDGTPRQAQHVVQVLQAALDLPTAPSQEHRP